MNVIPEWKQAWRLLSVQVAALVAAIAAAEQYLPQIQPYLPEGWMKYAALAVIVARLVKQSGPATDKAANG